MKTNAVLVIIIIAISSFALGPATCLHFLSKHFLPLLPWVRYLLAQHNISTIGLCFKQRQKNRKWCFTLSIMIKNFVLIPYPCRQTHLSTNPRTRIRNELRDRRRRRRRRRRKRRLPRPILSLLLSFPPNMDHWAISFAFVGTPKKLSLLAHR